jgi:MFS family permease
MFWLSGTMSGWMFQVFAIAYGLSYGGSFAMLSVLVAETFGVTHLGKIFGFAGIGSAAGGLLGPWLAGYIFDTTGSYSIAFVIGAGSTIATVVLILLTGRNRLPSMGK